MSAMKGWITTIAVCVIFITAVEMILPNTSMKKYCKFVLGLILMTVIINPIIKAFTGEIPDIQKSVKNYEAALSGKIENSDSGNKGNVDITLKNFKYNMETTCLKILKEKFPDENYKVVVSASYDDKKNEFSMDSIEIGFSNGEIKKVEKVNINTKNDPKNDKKAYLQDNKISKYLSDYLNISEKKIKVYKIE